MLYIKTIKEINEKLTDNADEIQRCKDVVDENHKQFLLEAKSVREDMVSTAEQDRKLFDLINEQFDRIKDVLEDQHNIDKDLFSMIKSINDNLGEVKVQEMSEDVFNLIKKVNALIETHPNKSMFNAELKKSG